MDPNANLDEQREIARRLLQATEWTDDLLGDANRLAELVEAMDEWIRQGGFLPGDWKRAQRDARMMGGR